LALDPDPLQAFASIIGEIERGMGENVEVAIDLVVAAITMASCWRILASSRST
jgi:hypothetical protein